MLKTFKFRFWTIANKEVTTNGLRLLFCHYIQNTQADVKTISRRDSSCVQRSKVGGLSQLPWRDPDVKKDGSIQNQNLNGWGRPGHHEGEHWDQAGIYGW